MNNHIPPHPPDAQCSAGSSFIAAARERLRRQRLVEHLHRLGPSPRPRRLEVRITAAGGGAPYGRSRGFRLTHDDLDMRMERRA
jgi:hypothetical protein